MTSPSAIPKFLLWVGIGLFAAPSLLGCSGQGEDDAQTASPSSSVLVAEPSSLDFGGVTVGANASADIVLSNQGTSPLTISGFQTAGDTLNYEFETQVGELSAGESLSITVVFVPGTLSETSATLTVLSDADNAPSLTIAITGEGESPDNDEDGFTVQEGDCNDRDSSVYPGAQETCNGIDNNCKNDEDDASDRTTWYVDADRDGYGDPSNRGKQTSCTKPAATGWSENKEDCDDQDASIHPEAEEICDEEDNDCDDQIDEGFDLNDDFVADCLDADGDGFTGEDGDCDDANSDVNPLANEFSNGIDDNCNGIVDENSGPDIWILSPNSDIYLPPLSVLLTAQVVDDYDGPESLLVDVIVRNITTGAPVATACAALVPDEGGMLSCDVPLSYGVNELTVTARDTEALTGSTSVQVVADNLPAIDVRIPEEGLVVAYGVSTPIEVALSDPDELLDINDVLFSTDLQPTLSPDRVVPSINEVGVFTVYLTFRQPGKQFLSAVVNDTLDGEGLDSALIQVEPPDCSSADARALWHFDEGSGVTTTDDANGLTGTLAGSVAWTEASVTTDFASALLFGGSGAEVRVEDPGDLLSLTSFTIDLWFKGGGASNQTLGRQALVYKNAEPGGNDRPNYYLAINNNGFFEVKVTPANGATALTASDSTTELKGSTWYHLAATFDGRLLSVFVNGSLGGSFETVQPGTTLRTAKGPLYLGVNKDSNTPGGPSSLTGTLDELQILDCALPASDIQLFYQTRAPHQLP